MLAYTVEPLYVQNGQELLACDYFRPRDVVQPPIIIMAHGFAALRHFKLFPFAQRFAQAGYAVILFDYRYWGGSTGQPREMVSLKAQIEDWYSIISYVLNRKDIDKQNVILWGTGLSGGYVLKLASELKNIRAVMSQVPFVDGAETAKLYPIQQYPKAIKLSSQDYMRAKMGLSPIRLPVVHPFSLSFFPGSHSYNGYMSIVHPEYYWSGEVPARALFELFRFRPVQSLSQLKVPVLLIAAQLDQYTSIASSRETATNIASFVSYHEWEMAHFEIYQQPWLEKAILTQLTFLEQHIGVVK